MRIKIINSLILLAIGFMAIPNTSAATLKKNLKFSGKVIDIQKQFNVNKLHIYYNINDGFDPADVIDLLVPIDNKGNFNFDLPDLNKPYRIYIVLFSGDQKTRLINESYFANSKDNVIIHIQLSKTEADTLISFTGIGAEKYNLVQKIEKQFWRDYYSELELIENNKDSSEISLFSSQLSSLLSKYKIKKSHLINTSGVNSEMGSIINMEYGRYNNEWVFRAETALKYYPNFRQQIVRNYFKYSGLFFDKPNKLSLFCPFYQDNLLLKDLLELMMQNHTTKVNIKSFYKKIKTANYFDDLRDKLIAGALLGKTSQNHFESFTFKTMDSLLQDGIRIVRTPYLKKKLIEKSKAINKFESQKIIESEFVGLDGKKFQLSSLKGKVFLIDTWFNGCFGCALFHEEFEKEVYSKFKDNKDFVMLSVNIDKKKEMWIKGISSKKYTSEDYINVTTGNWLDHPFLKYYNVKGSPWMMLVDADGNICYQPVTASSEEILTQINNALTKKKANELTALKRGL